MFKTAELGRSIPKEDYQAQALAVRSALLKAQMQLKDAATFPMIVVMSGDDRVGLLETLNLMHEWMDARFLDMHALDHETDEERDRPEYWRFWRILPSKGRVGIIFGSWYRHTIQRGVAGGDLGRLEKECNRINAFEKALTEDGALIVKLWFHLPSTERSRRLKEMQKDKKLRWRVKEEETNILKVYETGTRIVERVIRETSTADASWHIIEGTDWRYRNVRTAQILHDELTARLEKKSPAPAMSKPSRQARKPAGEKTVLSSLDLTQTLPRDVYEKRLADYQHKLNELMQDMIDRRRSSILLFEGWDAAGKGGIIRRIIPALDARHYSIIPISAPTDEELSHHYLWRFWRHLPGAGRMTVFDRSWYGRVLVERVEGYANEAEWKRAYKEIIDFEEQLLEHGIVLLKFWLHVDKQEQLRRFREREHTDYKQFKITAEDWRNRGKWAAYEAAANEMLERTSSEFAPWYTIEADDKKFARIKVIRTVVKSFKAALKNGKD